MTSLGFIFSLVLALLCKATITKATCPPFSGTFIVDQPYLYPENLDFDSKHCKVYFGDNYNATVTVYNPYTHTIKEVITFPGISNNAEFHVSGVDFDPKTGLILFVVNSPTPFASLGANSTGLNYIISYNTSTKKVVFKADLTEFLATVQRETGLATNGIQDIATDSQGYHYVPTSFGAKALARITADGEVRTWYATNKIGTLPPYFPTTYTGLIFHTPSNKLIVTDGPAGTFVTFDTKAAVGIPQNVTITRLPSDYTKIACDGLLNPSRYPNRDVLLCSENFLGSTGSITVFTSTDDWVSAQYAGRVPNNDPRAARSFPSATVEIAQSLYISLFFYADTNDTSIGGNRSSFPFFDITSNVDALVTPLGVKISS